jgi:ferredoxin-NADP reductase
VIAKPIRNTWRRGSSSTAARVPVWITVRLADEQGFSPAITGVAVSPQYRNDYTVFVATSAGIFVSRDAGRHFAHWSGGMGATPVVALAVTGKPSGGRGEQWVYALGLGGTIWRRRADES